MTDQPTGEGAYERERDAILACPCQCVSCPDCNGRGHTYRDSGWDVDSETCDYCDGSGVSEDCDRCQELTELEHAYEINP